MPTALNCLLPDRAVICVTGVDAVKLLDGLVTNSLSKLDDVPAIHTGLLSPQGKILFDFFLIKDSTQPEPAFLIDTSRDQIADLIKRLTFYRLRAKVQFEDISEEFSVAATWLPNTSGATTGTVESSKITGISTYPDPRHPSLGTRTIYPVGSSSTPEPELPGIPASLADYQAHRIALGIPDAGADYALSSTFPHEAMYDQLHSVDFKKGCFIGQEVVSRMQHRGTARKRIIPIQAIIDPGTDKTGEAQIKAELNLIPNASITAGQATIGTITSVSGHLGMALLRLDRANEALAKGDKLQSGSQEITILKPDWVEIDISTGQRTTPLISME